jgi:pimeloyl-ACP methyl ester carboxylesterase
MSKLLMMILILIVCLSTAYGAFFPATVKFANLSSGIKIFYREAGDTKAPTILLLHGFPSSSHQYRNLIPLLSPKYHVVAPDYPGFGFTEVPSALKFNYTFESITTEIASLLDTLNITKFTPYIFDYGAPVALRLALQRPDAVTAIISQNGNAYVEGFGRSFWAPIFALWNATTEPQVRKAASAINMTALTFDGVKSQYVIGSSHPESIAPESYWLDDALLNQPGNKDIQLSLLRDYATNVPLYPQFQQYFRSHQPKLLAAWGRKDIVFVPPGAKAFRRDLPSAEIHFIEAGHFLLETDLLELGDLVLDFLNRTL